MDDNGAFSNGDPGLRSVTVSARGTNTLGMAVATTAVTDCTGYYQFVIGRGSYNISKSNPAGFVDAPKSHLKSWTNVTLGSANLNQTWGVTTNASALGTSNIGCYISGRVFVDNLPTDGLFNITRENAISGVALKLTGKDIFGTSVSLTTTSASCSSTSCGGTSGCTTRMCADTSCTGQPVAKININGMYWFSGLKSGVYNVTETQPLGYQDPATGPKTVLTVDLRSTCYSTGNDFAELGQAGYWTSSTSLTTTSKTTLTTSTRTTSQTRTRTVAPFPGSVEGRVYSDDNSNGQYDGDVIDTPIGAVRIDIIGTDYLGNRVLMSSYSDPQTGMYSFAGVPAGTHRIVENHPDGYVNPPTGAQDEYAVTITSGLAIKNLDFIDVAE